MDEKLAIKTLKRVHDSAVNGEPGDVPAIAEQFNQALSAIQSSFPENEVLQSIEPVDEEGGKYIATTGQERIERVKLRTEQISDTLELGGGFERPSDEDEMSIITLEYSPSQEVNQEANPQMSQEANPQISQEANQEVSVESIMELIDLDPQVQNNKEEVKEIVRQFNEELESDEPDSGRLRQFISDAKGYSTSVAAKLAMVGLQAGAVGILGL